ncbi:hypothetical protein CI102_7428 [Trichoderma harzianum]|nr:hypothetical protein CI102_7428 [Trichoderma harzianum]
MIVVFCKVPYFSCYCVLLLSPARRSTKVGNTVLARLDHRNQLTGTHAARLGRGCWAPDGSLGFSRLGTPRTTYQIAGQGERRIGWDSLREPQRPKEVQEATGFLIGHIPVISASRPMAARALSKHLIADTRRLGRPSSAVSVGQPTRSRAGPPRQPYET